VVQDEQHRTEDVAQLLRKQLPLLTQRLRSTLEKLSAPRDIKSANCNISQWWQQLKDRYIGRDISFVETIEHDCEIPYESFDSILENLLQNAREKRIEEPGTAISVVLESKQLSDTDKIRISVTDSGSAIPDEISKQLFHDALQSESGFGIGLYQSHQQAARMGYRLALKENRSGNVCFVLENQSSPQVSDKTD
jgi:K+-sensing histidine kinase KdpD